MKKLIVYYSRANENYTSDGIVNLEKGNTEIVAEHIKKYTGYDIFKIEQEVEYSSNYYICGEQAKADKEKNARPKLKHYLQSIDNYDEFILCYPNFWGTLPMAVFTFLEAYDFTDKTIRPLCTHEGSGLGVSVEDIKATCPGSIVKDGLAVQGSRAEFYFDKIYVWLDKSN